MLDQSHLEVGEGPLLNQSMQSGDPKSCTDSLATLQVFVLALKAPCEVVK